MSAAARLLADLRARGVRVECPAPGRLRLVAPRGALSTEELAALRPRKQELLALLEPPSSWLSRRALEWLAHLRAYDPAHADAAFARELALDDWRVAQAREPGGVQ